MPSMQCIFASCLVCTFPQLNHFVIGQLQTHVSTPEHSEQPYKEVVLRVVSSISDPPNPQAQQQCVTISQELLLRRYITVGARLSKHYARYGAVLQASLSGA